MRRLPPLTAVEAFVQVARLGSVKAAAEALALSSPALSRRIQAFEAHIGHLLFDRRHQAVHLNAAGLRLLSEIAPAIDRLGLAIERETGGADFMRLRLGVMPLFASQRLIHRLAELRLHAPDLHIDIDTGGHALARLDDSLDAAIALATEVDPALYMRRLDDNRIVAVGARSASLEHLDQLTDATIFVHRDLPDTFEIWRQSIGRPDLEPAAIDMFDSGQLILEAAAQGLGVAFMLESHINAANDDRLVPLFGIAAQSPYSYWFACRRSALSRRPVKIFHDWLFDAFELREAA